MKNKGSALIFVLCVVTLLSVLTLILVNEATSAFILTSANAKKRSSIFAVNRANINKFLVQHLKGYADAFRFKIYKWEEI